MEHRWPWLMAASGLWTTTVGLTFLTCHTDHLGPAIVAAIVGQAACVITALVIGECILRKMLEAHFERVGRMVADERVRVETIARESARAAIAEVQAREPSRIY